MRKILVATTALAGIGLLVGTAKAAEPIKLQVGGMMNQWVGVVFQEEDKRVANAQYGNFGVVSDTEIHFKGETTLDNGIKIAVVIEKEAERTNTAGATTAGTTNRSNDRNADQQYVVVTTNFGEFSIGERDDVQLRVHSSAPRVGPGTDIMRQFITARTGQLANPVLNAAYDSTGFDAFSPPAEKIDYISPSFSGLSIALGYTPSVYANGVGGRGVPINSTHNRNLLDGALVYAREVGGLKFSTDAGFATFQYPNQPVTPTSASGSAKAMSYGFKGSYEGFTLGGSYLRVLDAYRDSTSTGGGSVGGWAWDAGLSYETGPYTVGFTYFYEAQKETINTKGNDTSKYYQLGGKYTMGPGVDLLASVNYLNHKDEANTDASNTNGWAVITGINLAF
jgi:outer membrane protein OmpU